MSRRAAGGTLTHRCAACHEAVRVTALWWFSRTEKRALCSRCVASGFSFSLDGTVARWAVRRRLAAVLKGRVTT